MMASILRPTLLPDPGALDFRYGIAARAPNPAPRMGAPSLPALFVAVHEFVPGTRLTINDVRLMSASRG